MDEDLRRAERAHKEAPSTETLALLVRHRVRLGFGWHGERLPSTLYPSQTEHGVYYRAPSRPGSPYAAPIPLVYVTGGEVACGNCGPGGVQSHDPTHCDRCDGMGPTAGRVTIEPFYIGRYPIVWREWHAYTVEQHDYYARRTGMLPPRGDNFPIVNVTGPDIHLFCTWAGGRLPTEAEWRWAALGAPVRCQHCCGDRLTQGVCSFCKNTGLVSRRYPWDDGRGNEPPTPDHCVLGDHPEYGTESMDELRDGSTAPVVIDNCIGSITRKNHTKRCLACSGKVLRFMPARPKGVSWCGAHDLFGNVWEHIDYQPAASMGGSFRSREGQLGALWAPTGVLFSQRTREWRLTPRDDVGFRILIPTSG